MSEHKGGPSIRLWNLHEHGSHDDIRYRGPLTYQSFQALGWLCIVAAVAALMINLSFSVNQDMAIRLNRANKVLSAIGELALPLFLIANFARILSNAEGYAQQLLRNGLAMLGVFVVFNVAFYHLFVGSLRLVSADPDQVMPLVMETFRDAHKSGFFAFNIFVDLFLCTLFMFFLNYRPRRIFTGKRVVAFRLFAALPVGYEVASILLRLMSVSDTVELPVWSFPLLTVKPPIAFVVFMLMAVFIKTREWRYCRHGNTHEDYAAFLSTNRNSLHFSLFMALLVLSFAYILRFTEPSTPTFKDALWYCFAIVTTIGFGDVAAKSIESRIISVILGAYGIVVVALITSIIVNFYGEMKKADEREAE